MARESAIPDDVGVLTEKSKDDSLSREKAATILAVGVPVTADLEARYGDSPDDGARTVALAAALSVVERNLEDANRSGLFGIDEAVDRLAAARAAAPSRTFVLNA